MIFRILFISLFISSIAAAQPNATIKDLDIRIMPPKLDKNIVYSIQPKLERKVVDIFTQHNIVNSKESTFAVHPYLSLIEFGKIEGISKEVSVQLELNMLVKNVFSGQDILVFSHKVSGSGKTQNAAVNRAVSSIRPQRKAYAGFIEDLQTKISTYYNENCDAIVADAQRAMQNKEYQKAVTLLYVIPKNSACKTNNQAILDQAYQQYQTQNCQSFIQRAEVAMLKKDYKDAINLVGQVDPASPCSTDAKKMLQSITEKVDEQTAKKMEFLNKVYKDNVEIEKVRQESMKKISNTYIEGIKKD